jgi:hypothetical protein
MIVEFTRSSSNKCQVTFHHQNPETYLETIVERFIEAGIKIHVSSIKKEIPEVATVPPTVRIVVTLEVHQYEAMIRQAFMPETARTSVVDAGTF